MPCRDAILIFSYSHLARSGFHQKSSLASALVRQVIKKKSNKNSQLAGRVFAAVSRALATHLRVHQSPWVCRALDSAPQSFSTDMGVLTASADPLDLRSFPTRCVPRCRLLAQGEKYGNSLTRCLLHTDVWPEVSRLLWVLKLHLGQRMRARRHHIKA